jgi:hypothetical protein
LSISGTLLDANGLTLSNSEVRLYLASGALSKIQRSTSAGQYLFRDVATGAYYLTVNASGFAPYRSDVFSVTGELPVTVPPISMHIAGVTTSVTVLPTEVVAEQQVKQEEKQRIFGIVPNFYVSYLPNAAPLTSRQKWNLAAHDTFDGMSFVGVSAGAGVEQAANRYPDYGQGAEGYARRWGALYADGRTSDLLDHYVFASLLHQDPRYFYQGTGSTKSRFMHAVGSAFIARSDSGRNMPNYSYLLGDICSGAISNLYAPSSERGAGLVFTNAAIGIAGRSFKAVVEEFIAKKFTRHAAE